MLGPGEVDIFGIAINSFGACADGSCSERNVCADVTLENGGDPILANACVQFSTIVDNTLLPKYPGLTIQDDLKVIGLLDAQWSNVAFRDGTGNGIDATHGQNLLDRPDQRVVPATGIQMTGETLREQFEVPFASTFTDHVTLPQHAVSATWQAFYFYQQDNFQRRGNEVILNGINQLDGACAFPSITLNEPQNPSNNFAQIIADVSNGCNWRRSNRRGRRPTDDVRVVPELSQPLQSTDDHPLRCAACRTHTARCVRHAGPRGRGAG
ncbi:MAG TPA: hypothetical protein VKP65_18440 [Rhodothermales bacterium]|nr:hypothetical protein [Rhodothermales bacterium]